MKLILVVLTLSCVFLVVFGAIAQDSSGQRNAPPATEGDKRRVGPTTGAAALQDQVHTANFNDSTHEPRKDTGTESRLVTVTIWLAIVGALQVIALGVQAYVFWRTLRAINRQAGIMEHHSDHLGNLVTAAENNASAALASAEAAKDNARAAKKSADALINSERAWIMVDIQWDKTLGRITRSMGGEGESTGVAIRIVCTNQGRLPAWITLQKVQLEVTGLLSAIPQLQNPFFSNQYVPLAAGQKYESPWRVFGKGWPESGIGREAFIYGVVQYNDVFGSDRETWFGYLATEDGQLSRVSHSEYNKHT
jgi:hypothetical protein